MPKTTTIENATLPWTSELVPELRVDAREREILAFIACALRRQLEITMPEGARLVDGKLVLP